MLAAPGLIADPALRRALMVHRNTAAKAARDALFANFPVTAALVGEEAFAACASTHVEAAPPREARLCFYGDDFADFVARWPAFAEVPYLGEVARVEWQVIEALFAADAPTLDPDTLVNGIDPEAPLAWHPATRILESATPTGSLWLAHQSEAAQDALDTIVWEPQCVLITRPADAVELRVIDAATQAFLSGTSLVDAAARAAGEGGDVAGIFASLLAAGAFAAQHLEGELP